MSLKVQFREINNSLAKDKIVLTRLVDLQTMEFDMFCDYLAQGSMVTAADVAAVMKRIDTVLPKLLAMGQQVKVTPSGVTVRPTVRGCLTQKELRKRLEERADDGEKVDVDRAVTATDLTIDDLDPAITVYMPDRVNHRFREQVELKRKEPAKKTAEEEENIATEESDNQSNNKVQASASEGPVVPIAPSAPSAPSAPLASEAPSAPEAPLAPLAPEDSSQLSASPP